MARYIDGFLLPVPRRKLAKYKAISTKAGKVWKKYGALEYVECVIDDQPKWGKPFAKSARANAGEAVIFSWIIYKSRAHRDAVNKKVMADPFMQTQMDPKAMPFDMKRMAAAGFRTIVDL